MYAKRIYLAVLVALVSPTEAGNPEEQAWQRVRKVMDLQPFVQNVVLLVGREQRVFEHKKGLIGADQPLWVASASKMLFATKAMQLAERELLDLSRPVSAYLSYWSRDAADPRSRITPFHLLSFQSGYTFGLSLMDSCWLRPLLNFSACVERMYRALPLGAEPGTVWDYNEFHLQVVASIVERVLGRDIGSILQADLLEWNMTRSRYPHHEGPGGPDVSADLVTTATDYEQFLLRYFNGKLLAPETVRFMEQDHMPPWCSAMSSPLQASQGHYGIGNWLLCPFGAASALNPTGIRPLPAHCLDAKVHSDQGLFGFSPAWDRRLNYWMLFAQQGLPVSGDVSTALLYRTLKPYIDAAMHPELQEPGPEILQAPDWDALNATLKVPWAQLTSGVRPAELASAVPSAMSHAQSTGLQKNVLVV